MFLARNASTLGVSSRGSSRTYTKAEAICQSDTASSKAKPRGSHGTEEASRKYREGHQN
jgi:hypothetical protein